MNTEEARPLLVVDDDPQMRLALREAILRLGLHSSECDSGFTALDKLAKEPFSLVVTDMKMPKMDGLTLLREIRKKIGSIPVLVITGFGTVENAVESMKEGATDYLMKPFSFDTFEKAISTIMARIRNEREILTVNPSMQKTIALAASVAGSDITVLIEGESGTGKELLARYVHRASKRADRPFVAVNCAAIPENLLESELFGHERGAFTGATERKKGKFELADGGTLLLDEIGEMSFLLQAKLLRVLQEREIDRVGGKESIPVDVRVIATTNRELKRECSEGRFREDLYYRLSVFPIVVPPLRERHDDVLYLAGRFLEKFSLFAGKAVKGFDSDAEAMLIANPWKGNIRELENVVQRAVLVASGSVIGPADLGFDPLPERGGGPNGRIREMERELIFKTLKEVDGNKTKAAEILGVSVRTIRNKLNEYGKTFPAA